MIVGSCASRSRVDTLHVCMQSGHGERHVGHGGREVPYLCMGTWLVCVGGQLWYEGC